MDITKPMIEAAFDAAVTAIRGECSFAEADRMLVAECGFNASSAKDYTRNLKQMLEGKRYTRTLNAEATRIYFDRIAEEFGRKGLLSAVEATEQHINYYARLKTGAQPRKLSQIVHEYRQNFAIDAPLPSDVEFRTELDAAIARSLTLHTHDRQNRLKNAPVQATPVYTISKQYRRNADVVAETLENANGTCQSCGLPAPFNKPDGSPYLEVHHRIPLAEGGEDTVENAVALCPNCHREAHHGENWKNFRP